jgi:NRPS condensation-like uncharacterized protein
MKMPAQTVPLNFNDILHLATSDVSIANTNVVTLRFKEPHTEDEIRTAMRYMITIYPKLRSVIEPTLFSYRFRILQDQDPRVDILFRDSFRSFRNIEFDSPEYIELRRNLYNEPISMEQALTLKIRYCDNARHPVLLIGLRHVSGDASSWIHMSGSLMSYLNGVPLKPYPLDDPSLNPVFYEDGKGKLIRQISQSIQAFTRRKVQPKKITAVPATEHTADFYGPVDICHQTLSLDMDALRSKSKQLKCTINTLFLTALSILFSRERVKDLGDTISIGLPIDLRQYYPDPKPIFGNYLSGMEIQIPIDIWDDPEKIISHISTQINHNLNLLINKQMLAPYIIFRLTSLAGRKIYAEGIRMAKRKGLINRTCGLSNIGNLDHLNSHGPRAQLFDAISCGVSHGLLFVINSMDGKFHIKISFQQMEFARERIKDFILKLEGILGELLEL